MNKEYYCQCLLKKKRGNNRSQILTTWIPEKYAKKGKWLDLKENNKWEEYWQVMEIYGKERKDVIFLNETEYKYQRKISDI